MKGLPGPNTEIFYDAGEAYGQDDPAEEMYPGGENERYLEVWNLDYSVNSIIIKIIVTHHYLIKILIPAWGLSVWPQFAQNVRTNYETDLFMPIMNGIEKVSGKQYLVNNEQDVAFKVIADHIRTITLQFLIVRPPQ
ncbi:alanine--tRNA ligase-related protein [Staphylococcus aureus]